VHLACVPISDPDEAAAIVNALQRHATVVVQKSLAEGFGLTVAEAMWKSRPMVASAVGGISDQISDEQHGLLIADPCDLRSFGAAVERLLCDPQDAERLGTNARARALTEFLGDRHLEQYGQLFADLGWRRCPLIDAGAQQSRARKIRFAFRTRISVRNRGSPGA
jgi:trehalose synthase